LKWWHFLGRVWSLSPFLHRLKSLANDVLLNAGHFLQLHLNQNREYRELEKGHSSRVDWENL
jgi:hypothetical protein